MTKKLSFALALVLCSSTAFGQIMDSSITYQGQLEDGGSPASGTFNFEFYLFTQASGGSTIEYVAKNNVTVTDGLFTVRLNFGTLPFNGQQLWLETRVQQNGGSGYVTLPRQKLSAAPYALYCEDSDTLDGYDSNAFVNVGGDSMNGDLHMSSNNVVFTAEHGIESTYGAKITTGGAGSTFQFHPGTFYPNAAIASFNNINGERKMLIDHAGDIVIGGMCFGPREMIRCYLPNVTNHLTWIDNEQECSNAGGAVDGRTWVLAEKPCT